MTLLPALLALLATDGLAVGEPARHVRDVRLAPRRRRRGRRMLGASARRIPGCAGVLAARSGVSRRDRATRSGSSDGSVGCGTAIRPAGGFWIESPGVMARPVLFLVASLVVLGSLGISMLQHQHGELHGHRARSPMTSRRRSVPHSCERELRRSGSDRAGGDRRSTATSLPGGAGARSTSSQRPCRRCPRSLPQTQLERERWHGDLAVLCVPVPRATSRATCRSRRSGTSVRSTCPPRSRARTLEVLVGGETAFIVDFFDQSDTYKPIVFAFVLGSVVPAPDGRVPVGRLPSRRSS